MGFSCGWSATRDPRLPLWRDRRVVQCVKKTLSGFGHVHQTFDVWSQKDDRQEKLTIGEVVRRWVNKRLGARERTLGLRFGKKRRGLWPRFRLHGGEVRFGGAAGVVSTSEVACERVRMNVLVLKVEPALAHPGGKNPSPRW